jgi:CelD/BcsL family acetyltransferase involved in cellulose biosynthesis
MQLYVRDPLTDPSWATLAAAHPRASVFHAPGWLQALKRTYAYEPLLFTTSGPAGPLANGWVFCRVKSRFTGRRLVSLPFSDYCDPLLGAADRLPDLLTAIRCDATANGAAAIEIRPLVPLPASDEKWGRDPRAQFFVHQVDLEPDLDQIFGRLQKSSIQRKIRKAERVRLEDRHGNSLEILEQFYRLMILTRRRHRLPPQPFTWFRNLADCLGDAFDVRIASHEGAAIASIVTLTHGRTMFYKYGCSDASLHHLGGMPFLFWRAIEDAKSRGFGVFDLGRSDADDQMLLTFKDRWGASRLPLAYWKSPRPRGRAFDPLGWLARTAQRTVSLMPDRVLTLTGRLIYRHIG